MPLGGVRSFVRYTVEYARALLRQTVRVPIPSMWLLRTNLIVVSEVLAGSANTAAGD